MKIAARVPELFMMVNIQALRLIHSKFVHQDFEFMYSKVGHFLMSA